jgi:hypothetical protein
MSLPQESETFQDPPAPYVPTQADQDAATAMFAESADRHPSDYDMWLDMLRHNDIDSTACGLHKLSTEELNNLAFQVESAVNDNWQDGYDLAAAKLEAY